MVSIWRRKLSTSKACRKPCIWASCSLCIRQTCSSPDMIQVDVISECFVCKLKVTIVKVPCWPTWSSSCSHRHILHCISCKTANITVEIVLKTYLEGGSSFQHSFVWLSHYKLGHLRAVDVHVVRVLLALPQLCPILKIETNVNEFDTNSRKKQNIWGSVWYQPCSRHCYRHICSCTDCKKQGS